MGLAVVGGETFDMINEARTIARTGNYAEALDKLQEAIASADENEEKLALAIAYNNVAEIHRIRGNNIEALESYSQALQVYHEMGHRSGISSTGQKIDKILGRSEKTKTLANPETVQNPLTVQPLDTTQAPVTIQPTGTAQQPTVVVQTPKTVETTPPVAPLFPQEIGSTVSREKRIEDAIKRVRNRVKDRQAFQGPGETVGSEVPRSKVMPPQEPLQQSAKLVPPVNYHQTDYNAYLKEVKENIVDAWRYPEHASEQGEQGKVDVEFTIRKDGRLLKVQILQSSGFATLDREAIRAVGAASPFTPIPKQIALEQLSIRFTFNYTLEKRQGSR